MSKNKLLSRDELLGGFLSGDKRRATIAVSLIEARTVRLSMERASVNAPYMTEGAFKERNQAFFRAIADGAQKAAKVTIQDLERHALDWSILVPAKPEIRAEMARIFGENYRFSLTQVPHMAAALGVDDGAVQAAFKNLHAQPIDTIFDDGIAPLESLRWAWMRITAKLEGLPPFWTAFALTLTEIIGAGTLALPIAFAAIGPLPGAGFLILLGLVNLLTVGYLAEASARNGSIKYGSAFIGQLLSDYLGPFAVVVMRLSLFGYCCIILIAYYTGFAATITAITGLPSAIAIAAIFTFGALIILRKSLIGTMSSALLIGFINISILVILSLIAFTHADADNLTRIDLPLAGDRPFDASLLQLVFGIIMVSYFGHLSVSNCAQTVLRREPDGRSLKTGTMAAVIVSMVIYVLWAVAVGSAIDADRLASETGTALVPLAEKAGLGVHILGTAFVILAIGMSSVHYSLGIFNMAREIIASKDADKSILARFKITKIKNLSNLLALAPVLAIFAYVQWAFFAGNQSFIEPLKVGGVLLVSLVAVLFPVLLLAISRRRGRDVGGAKLSKAISHPIVLVAVGLIAFISVISHGTIIWDDPIPQGLAFLVALVMVICVIDLMRKRAFASQLLVEVYHLAETTDEASVHVAFDGASHDYNLVATYLDGSVQHRQPNDVIGRFSQCQKVAITLAETPPTNLRLQALKVSVGNDAQPMEGEIVIEHLNDSQSHLNRSETDFSGPVSLPAGPMKLTLRLNPSSP